MHCKAPQQVKEHGRSNLCGSCRVNPISKVDRKGTMGSYYAVADYTAINPEFGTMADWKKLVNAIHARE